MRYLVLIFGLLGVGGAGFVSYRWGTDWLENHQSTDAIVALLKAPMPQNQFHLDLTTFYNRQRTLPFVLASAVLGLFGTFLSFIGRRGFSAALLLLVSGAGPALFGPPILIFTGALAVAGFFSLFVRQPRPKDSSRRDEDLDE